MAIVLSCAEVSVVMDVVVMLSAESFMRGYLGQGQVLEGAAQLAGMIGSGVCGTVLVLYSYCIMLYAVGPGRLCKLIYIALDGTVLYGAVLCCTTVL